MIRLNSITYRLYNITVEDFWLNFDNITVGQNINPEIGYTTLIYQLKGKVFGGRKVKNKFSIYLYRPLLRGLSTEVLTKGIVNFNKERDCLEIVCKYEISFWSLLIIAFGGITFIGPFFLFSLATGITISLIASIIIGLIINSKYIDVRRILYKQFDKISKVDIDR